MSLEDRMPMRESPADVLGASLVDVARLLAGEIRSLSAHIRGLASGGVRHYEEVSCLLEFESGAVGSIEVTGCAYAGKTHRNEVEDNGEGGSIRLNLERPGELETSWVSDGELKEGFQTIQAGGVEGSFKWQEVLAEEVCHFYAT